MKNNKKTKINHHHNNRCRRLQVQKLQLFFVLILIFAICTSYKTSILSLSTSTTTTSSSSYYQSSSDSFSKGSTGTTTSTSSNKLDVVESSSSRILRFDNNNKNNNNTNTEKISSSSSSSSTSSMSISRSFYIMENVWNEYKSYHSIDVLRQEQEQEQQDKNNNNNNNTNLNIIKRKYQVIYYICPKSAGNYLHDIYNQVIIAIATNRTMLWKYYDNETCWEVVRKQQQPNKEVVIQGDCPMGGGIKPNTIHDCNKVLIKKSWIPTYDEWVPKLLLQQQQQQNGTTTNTTTTTTTTKEQQLRLLLPKRQGGSKATIEWTTSQMNAFKAMIFPQPLYRHQQFLNSTATTIASEGKNNQILEKLYSNGSQILYGMLFRKLFDINPNILLPSSSTTSTSTSTTLQQQKSSSSYALHSRHIFPSDNGSNIKNEMNCLETVLGGEDEGPQKSSSCVIYLMSDRDLNRQLVANYIRSEYPFCIPILPTHHNNTTETTTTTTTTQEITKTNLEHGTNAGGGFFQDIAIATNARDGFIGTCSRTSSYLIEEIIQYDRRKEFVVLLMMNNKKGSSSSSSSLLLPPFKTCCLPNDETGRKKLLQQQRPKPKPRRQT